MKGPPQRRQRIGMIQPRSLLRVCSPVEPAIGLLKELLWYFRSNSFLSDCLALMRAQPRSRLISHRFALAERASTC
jgi:hypothetical protein